MKPPETTCSAYDHNVMMLICFTEVPFIFNMLAQDEGKGFCEWLKDELTHSCPEEQTLLQMLEDVRREGYL